MENMKKENIKIFRELQDKYGLEKLKDFVFETNKYLMSSLDDDDESWKFPTPEGIPLNPNDYNE